MYYSRVDIILFGTGLFKSAFSTFYLIELDFCFSAFQFFVFLYVEKNGDQLRVDFTEFARQFSGLRVFGFDRNSIGEVHSFSSRGIQVHMLKPTKATVLISYLTVRMSHGFNLSLFPRGFYEVILQRSFYKVKNLIHDFGSKLQIIFKCCNK